MRIALRTGGGRGVYELAGSQGNCAASDLFGLEILYELTPEIVLPGRSVAEKRQGKPRIVLNDSDRSRTTHVYRLLSAVLLLPKPKREFRTTHGTELLCFEAFSMTAIKVDVVRVTSSTVTLRPTDLLLENADGLQTAIGFTSRMARILHIWQVAEQQDLLLAELVRSLAAAIRTDDPDYKIIESRAQAISNELGTTGDALLKVEQFLGIQPDLDETIDPQSMTPIDNNSFGVEDDISAHEARIKRAKIWRRQIERGAIGRKFSLQVGLAYNYRCLFSGQRLPRLDVTDSTGVDSAHILPWSTYELNSVRNGVCLNKQCHWAFDEGVLRLDFDSSNNGYVLSLPDNVIKSAARADFDLTYFTSLQGLIPRSRLPPDTSLWPSPKYLAEYNTFLATA